MIPLPRPRRVCLLKLCLPLQTLWQDCTKHIVKVGLLPIVFQTVPKRRALTVRVLFQPPIIQKGKIVCLFNLNTLVMYNMIDVLHFISVVALCYSRALCGVRHGRSLRSTEYFLGSGKDTVGIFISRDHIHPSPTGISISSPDKNKSVIKFMVQTVHVRLHAYGNTE